MVHAALGLLPSLLIVPALFLTPGVVAAHGSRAVAAAPSSTGARAGELTRVLADLAAQYRAGPSSRRAALEAAMHPVAVAREEALLALIADDPALVLALALPTRVRTSLPASVRARLEHDADIEGRLEIVHEDGIDASRYLYRLQTALGVLSLHFATDPPTHLLTGAQVRVRGVQVQDVLALASGHTSVHTVAAAPATGSLGAQTTLLILVTFSDAPAQPYTVEDARSVMFGTTSSFFLENSYQQTWLTGDVVGWFTIATTSTACDTSAIATQAQAAATAAGVNLGAYVHQVYAFPQNYACAFWGRSSVGGSPSQTWINGDCELGVTGHELGHALGLYHSHSIECGGTTLCASPTLYEYGDTFDIMGASASAHFGAFQKERLGWLGAGTSPPITTVAAAGTYTLDAYETTGSGPKALKILKSTDPGTGQRTWYYVESRHALGFDSVLSSNVNVLGGVLVRTGTENNANSSYLIDMVPASGPTLALDWSDPALVVGQSFHDASAGLTITPQFVTTTGATVMVQLDQVVAVSTDRASYTRNQSATITATVSAGAAPVAGAGVAFTVKRSDGSVVTASATTGTNGAASYRLRLGKQDPVGTYQASVVATKNAWSGTAATTFTVR